MWISHVLSKKIFLAAFLAARIDFEIATGLTPSIFAICR